MPVSVAAVNDYELIVEGLARMLGRYPDRLTVKDRIVMGEPIEQPVDVVLYDTYGRLGIAGPALRELSRNPLVGAIAVFTLELNQKVMADALEAGATAFISKALSGNEIADAIVRVARGEPVIASGPSTRAGPVDLDWPGKDDGLSQRESEVLVLTGEGLTNSEIADALYVGIETVKSHLHHVYSKLGFRNRVEAAAWVQRSGAFTRYQPAMPPDVQPPESRD